MQGETCQEDLVKLKKEVEALKQKMRGVPFQDCKGRLQEDFLIGEECRGFEACEVTATETIQDQFLSDP